MVKSSLTHLGVIPQDTHTQSQVQSPKVDLEHPQIEDISQAQPMTSTSAKPTGSQIQAIAQAQPQAPGHAQMWPPASAQPARLAKA